MKRTPTKASIDSFLRYIANRVDYDKWFSVKGGPGWSVYDELPVWGCAPEADFAARLGFLEFRMNGGSLAYMQYRITRSGLKHVESLR